MAIPLVGRSRLPVVVLGALVALGLLTGGPAHAASWSVAPTAGLVGQSDMDFRPGLRLGFEPAPAAAIELFGESGFSGGWGTGLALAGRGYLLPGSDPGEGIFLLGRLSTGLAGDEGGELGPLFGVAGGFGVRPVSVLNIEASFGPEWAPGGHRWRTELSVGVVFDGKSLKSRPGAGNVRHKPRPIPGR